MIKNENDESKFASKECIIDSLQKLKDRIDSAISYMNFKGEKGNIKNHIHDLNELQFWSSSIIRQYIVFIDDNFTP